MSTIIKKLTAFDVDLFIDASQVFYEKKVSKAWALEYLSNTANFFYIVYVGDELAGFVSGNYIDIWQKKLREIFIYDLEVLEKFRRKGLATELLKQAIEDGKILGYKNPWVLAEDRDEQAKSFYTSLGGKPSTAVMFDL